MDTHDNLPKLAYDHNKIIDYGVDRLRAKIKYTNIAQYLLPEEFTLSELQTVYETVTGKRLDKRNFRKKISASGILKDTKLTRKQGSNASGGSLRVFFRRNFNN